MRHLSILALLFTFACNPGGTVDGGASLDAGESIDAGGGVDAGGEADGGGAADLLSGVYNVEAVTCNGVDEALGVVATVTFDGTSYLEEWEFPSGDCELSLAGTVASTEDQVTLEDVVVSCNGGCPPDLCAEHCSVDQVYDYARDGDELLLSFTQNGTEDACGPCGDGVPTTYLLVEEP